MDKNEQINEQEAVTAADDEVLAVSARLIQANLEAYEVLAQ